MTTLPARIQRSFAAAHPSLPPGARRRFGRVAVVALLALLVLVTGQRPASALSWQIKTADFSGRVGMHSSLELDADGNPRISYYDSSTLKLKYAAWNGTGWDVQIVDTTADVGKYTSLELDADGWPHISYLDETNKKLRYAAWNETEQRWDLQTVDSTATAGYRNPTRLELDAAGYPHISYTTDSSVKYAAWNETEQRWDYQTIVTEIDPDDGVIDYLTSLALDSHGIPHIAYIRFDWTRADVMYATQDGSSWDIETIATTTMAEYISFALDADDKPHISYMDWHGRDLKYATRGEADWGLETVDEEGDVGWNTSLALDADGNPRISYYDSNKGDLKYAALNGSSWVIENVDTAAEAMLGTSLALDACGNPRISYYDSDQGDLKYAASGECHKLTIAKATNPAGGTGFPFTFDAAAPQFLAKWGDNSQFNNPTSVAVDGAGNVYVADTNNHRIQKFDSAGVYVTQWGSHGSGNIQFESPRGVAVDGAGNVYVADTGNNRIQKFTSAGVYVTQWGSQGNGDSKFRSPTGVVVDRTGNVYVADTGNNRIQKFTGDGGYVTQWGSQGNGDSKFNAPHGVAVDGAGNVYVADTDNYRVQKFTSAGGYLTQWGGRGSGDGQFESPTGVAVDGQGNVYVADFVNHRIQKFDSAGGYLTRWGRQGDRDGQFNLPSGVAVDGADNVYVADTFNHRIQKFAQQVVVLDDGESHTFTSLRARTYRVSELVPIGWLLDDVVCDGGSPTVSGNTITVTLAAGDDVTCTVTNTPDTTPPDVTINQAANQADPTDTGPINFLAIFSEPVSGFVTGDVTLSGSAGATAADVTEVAPNDGTTYNVAVSGMTANGTVIAGVAAGVAQDAAGNLNAASTSTDNSVTYNGIDDIAPDTTITSSPPNPSNSSSAQFAFSGDDGGGSGVASFECQLDGGAWETCGSPKGYANLSEGSHTFQVRATDKAGNTGPTPAGYSWTIDTTPPDTTITGNPPNPSNSSSAQFTFSGNDGSGSGVASFECQLDGGPWETCGSPKNYTGLIEGSHTFQVRATDKAGNTDPTPAGFTWTIDTTPPDTTITGNPPNPSNSNSAQFAFSGNAGGGSGVASFECQLDGGAWETCGSPKDYANLIEGSHTFQVRATDKAGNTGATPAGYSWVIDVTPPSVTINQASTQADPTGDVPINFTVVFSEAVSDFATGDVTLNGTAGATTATVSGGPTTYNVAVSGMTVSNVTGSGTVIAAIGAGAAHDAAGNGNAASTSSDNTVIYAPLSIYVSTTAAGSVNGLSFGSEDILKWDGRAWSVWFDGSAAGLKGSTNNINAFTIPEAGNAANSDTVLMSFIQNARVIPGVGKVDGMDLVTWNGSAFSLTFDGQDVGLTVLTAEKIDGLHELAPALAPAAVKAAAGGACLRYFLISTAGNGKVTNYDGSQLKISGEDVLGFCATQLGANTAGKWHMLLDGSAQGVKPNNITGIAASADGQTLYLTSNKAFNVDGAAGGHSMVYMYNAATQTFSGPIFSAPATGLHEKVDGIDVIGAVP